MLTKIKSKKNESGLHLQTKLKRNLIKSISARVVLTCKGKLLGNCLYRICSKTPSELVWQLLKARTSNLNLQRVTKLIFLILKIFSWERIRMQMLQCKKLRKKILVLGTKTCRCQPRKIKERILKSI